MKKTENPMIARPMNRIMVGMLFSFFYLPFFRSLKSPRSAVGSIL